MAYTDQNFQTKKALKDALASGKKVTVYQPNNMFDTKVPFNGTVYLEGPHYPQPHKWYVVGTMKDGYLHSVK